MRKIIDASHYYCQGEWNKTNRVAVDYDVFISILQEDSSPEMIGEESVIQCIVLSKEQALKLRDTLLEILE